MSLRACTLDELLHLADERMYAAKRPQGNEEGGERWAGGPRRAYSVKANPVAKARAGERPREPFPRRPSCGRLSPAPNDRAATAAPTVTIAGSYA